MLLLNKIPAVFLFIGLLCASQAKYYQGIVFEAKADDRLMLIDSALFFGLQTEDPALIGDLYLTKGTVYYSLKDYQQTLEQYLIAYDYIQRSGDPYGLHSVKNMIANLKNYLGYYQDAEELFQECVNYFGQDESNYNFHRGWMNSMMGLAWSLTKRGELTESVQILSEARESAQRMAFSELDLHYVIFKQGINAYFNSDFSESVQMISDQLPVLYDNEDFAWASVGELYLGKAHWDQGNQEEAMTYFRKIDELFREHRYTHPDLREAYELMISYYETMGDRDAQLRYIQQLVQVDQVYNEDHRFLLSTIYKKYTTQDLRHAKASLESALQAERSKSLWLIGLSSLLVVFLLAGVYYRGKKSKIRKAARGEATQLRSDVVEQLLEKLSQFEQKEGYLQPNITLERMAADFRTNTTYLSKVINTHKKKSFTQYLNGLRIEYVVQEMTQNEQSILFKYSIESLAKQVGFQNASVFTRAFRHHTGENPSAFIEKYKDRVI